MCNGVSFIDHQVCSKYVNVNVKFVPYCLLSILYLPRYVVYVVDRPSGSRGSLGKEPSAS